ncbi:MAG: hypothetical protein KDC53_17940, partial [Saprospiraceae bacterium]|nr:hypothetical protein [Saprospiraceae bacterium]
MRHTSFLLFLLTLISCQKPGPGDPPQGYRSATTLKLAYALGQLDLIDAEPVVPSNLTVYNDLVYKVLDDEQLALDIYHLDTLQKAAPLLIFIHGGAWRKGNRDDYRRYLVDYAEKGFVTATVS